MNLWEGQSDTHHLRPMDRQDAMVYDRVDLDPGAELAKLGRPADMA